MSNDINPADAIDLSSLKAQMQTSASAALAWGLQPTIFPVKHEGMDAIVPCLELTWQLTTGRETEAVAIPPDLIIGLVSALTTWLAQVQGQGVESKGAPTPKEPPAPTPGKK